MSTLSALGTASHNKHASALPNGWNKHIFDEYLHQRFSSKFLLTLNTLTDINVLIKVRSVERVMLNMCQLRRLIKFIF